MTETNEQYKIFFYDMCQRGCKRSNKNIGLMLESLNNGTSLDITKASRLDSFGNDAGAFALLENCCQDYDAMILTYSAQQFPDVIAAAELCLTQKQVPLGKIIVLGPDSFSPYTAFSVASGDTYLSKKEAANLVDKIREVSTL